MGDPARVYALRYADLESHRDLLLAALQEIAAHPTGHAGDAVDMGAIARDVLQDEDEG